MIFLLAVVLFATGNQALLNLNNAQVSHVNIPGVGPIDGLILQTPTTKTTYYKYLGIPYSHAKRFEVSTLAEPWTETYDCTKEGNVCPQPTGEVQFPFGMGEDCLVLSVTTPVNPNGPINQLRPVLVFFYGGAFVLGTSRQDLYNSEYLVQEDIVIVQPNYRIGTFGWVTDGEVIPRNIGPKDARTALLWVQKNIKYFGGDPNLVTIYGESAGSVLVSTLWHCNERLPPNLFRAVFMQSGQLIAPWTLQKDVIIAYRNVLRKTLCFYTIDKSPQEQVECLKRLPYQDLNLGDIKTVAINDGLEGGFTGSFNAAVVLEYPNDADALVIKKPLEQLQAGDIWQDKPLMISNCNYEMLTFGPFISAVQVRTNEQLVPKGMLPVNPHAVGGMIKQYYAGSELLWSAQLPTTYFEFMNDITMYFPARYFIELVQPKITAPIYVFEFSYVSIMGRFNDGISKVGHGDDIMYLWEGNLITQENLLKITYPPETWHKRAQFVRLLGNFVKFNNPTPAPDPLLDNFEWPRVTSISSVDYMHFDRELTLRQNPQNKNYPFWHHLYTEYATGKTTL